MMLGLGKWEFTVDSMLYRGKVLVTVSDKEGNYDVGVDIPGMDSIPPIVIVSIAHEGNDLTGIAKNSALGNKDIPFSFSFTDEDNATGFIKLPMIGKLQLKNGTRISA